MILIFSAPSGSGKSTLVQYLLDTRQDIELSISATTRAPRGQEQDGREYYFITPERFEQLIKEDAFEGCENLTSVMIPAGVTSIGDGAFKRCGRLTEISVDPLNKTYDSRNDCNSYQS